MVYFQEYLVQLGDRQKKLGIVGESHTLYNEKESQLASELVDRYSTIASEGTDEEENDPLYERIADFVCYRLLYPCERFGLGRCKELIDYAKERNKSPIFLEKDRSAYYRQADRLYQIKEAVECIFYLPLDMIGDFFGGLSRRHGPAIEEPEPRLSTEPGDEERPKDMTKSLLILLNNPSIEDVLVVVGKGHFLDYIYELANNARMDRIS